MGLESGVWMEHAHTHTCTHAHTHSEMHAHPRSFLYHSHMPDQLFTVPSNYKRTL